MLNSTNRRDWKKRAGEKKTTKIQNSTIGKAATLVTIDLKQRPMWWEDTGDERGRKGALKVSEGFNVVVS